MKLLIAKAERLAQWHAARILDALAEAAVTELPEGVAAERGLDRLTLRGRGLRMRSIVDARLRNFARLIGRMR